MTAQHSDSGPSGLSARPLPAGVALLLVLLLAVGSLPGLAPPAAADPGPADDAGAGPGQTTVDDVASGGEQRWIVTLDEGAHPAAVEGTAHRRGAQVGHRYRRVLRGFAMAATREEAAQVLADPRVARVDVDPVVRAASPQVGPPWGLDRIDQQALPLDQRFHHADGGAGVRAYVLDTGITPHVDFDGRLAAGRTFISDGHGTQDCPTGNGHGTHVAGTLGGTYSGVAKRVTLVPVRVLGCDGQGTASDLILALDWVVTQQAGRPERAVANLSLGVDEAHGPTDAAVRAAVAAGIPVVVAAGNRSRNACQESPAREGAALTVGATGTTDARAGFSNFGPCLDLFAPGAEIVAPLHSAPEHLTLKSGTSMAAPHVAGAVAVLLGRNPALSVAQVEASVVGTASTVPIANRGAGSPSRLLRAPQYAPDAPTGVVAVEGDHAARVWWTAPPDGGSPIYGYEVRAYPGGILQSVDDPAARSAVVEGLVNDEEYTFRVVAVNAVGASTPSDPSEPVTPVDGALVPSPPVAVAAVGGDGRLAVSWRAPEEDGGSEVSGYRVTAVPSGHVVVQDDGDARATDVEALPNGVSQQVRVQARNGEGWGPPSAPVSGMPRGAPTAPRVLTVTRADRALTVRWAAPADTGGAAITGYTVRVGTQVRTHDGAARSATITGLVNGTVYPVTVTATNTVPRTGPPVSGTGTPAAAPAAPASVAVAPGNGSATVTWTPPPSDGGSAVTGYRVTVSPGGATVNLPAGARTHTVSGLANGTTYAFSVTPRNAVGLGATRSASTTPRTVPGQPRSVTATAGNGQAAVSWTAPASDGGAAVTGYTVTASPGGRQVAVGGSARSATVPGLANGTGYRFTVRATNAAGVGPSSAASNAVTPVAPVTPPPAPTGPLPFDGNPATTQRVTDGSAVGAAVAISRLRFAAVGQASTSHAQASHVVLSRDDTFPDSLAGAPLTADGPLLFTATGSLTSATEAELRRVLAPGRTVYLLGGPAAVSEAVEKRVDDLGFTAKRLAGPSRVETSLVIADEVRRLNPDSRDILVARAYGASGNETSGWADSVTGGAYGARAGVPVVLTPTAGVHGKLAEWVARAGPARSLVLGGVGALSDDVLRALPGGVRISGGERTATAAAVATRLWGAGPSGARRFVLINGFDRVGWAHGLAAAGVSADAGAPLLLVTPPTSLVPSGVPGATAGLVSACGAAQVDLLLVGSTGAIPEPTRAELDRLDGGAC